MRKGKKIVVTTNHIDRTEKEERCQGKHGTYKGQNNYKKKMFGGIMHNNSFITCNEIKTGP